MGCSKILLVIVHKKQLEGKKNILKAFKNMLQHSQKPDFKTFYKWILRKVVKLSLKFFKGLFWSVKFSLTKYFIIVANKKNVKQKNDFFIAYDKSSILFSHWYDGQWFSTKGVCIEINFLVKILTRKRRLYVFILQIIMFSRT